METRKIVRYVGIDFGTSKSVVCYKDYNPDRTPLNPDAANPVPISQGHHPTMVPTLVLRDPEGDTYFGDQASVEAEGRPELLEAGFKMDLVSSDESKASHARELLGLFFGYLRERYLSQVAVPQGVAVEERTVVSYPVKWPDAVRDEMVKAASDAGFAAAEGASEPQAAMQYFLAVHSEQVDRLLDKGVIARGQPLTVLLLDMGAGTTDLVLYRYTPGAAEQPVLATWPPVGHPSFGGREVDERLYDMVRAELERFLARPLGRDDCERMRRACSEWKETRVSPTLARGDVVKMWPSGMAPYYSGFGAQPPDLNLDRAAFEKLYADYLPTLPALIQELIERATADGSIKGGQDVDLVVLTGGHSQWYFVTDVLTGRSRFGVPLCLDKINAEPERILQGPHPQETVARGAALSGMRTVEAQSGTQSIGPLPAAPASEGPSVVDAIVLGLHGGNVNALDVSPDGRRLATASDDGTVRLWNVKTGTSAQMPSERTGGIKDVVFSPDGKLLASGGSDKLVRIRDAQSGECLRSLAGHEGTVTTVAFSPNGGMVASGGRDNKARLWDVQTGACLRIFAGAQTLEEHWVSSVAFSTDGQLLASGSSDHTVRVWDTRSGACLRTLTEATESIYAVAFSPKANLLVAASWDKKLRFYDPRTGLCVRIVVCDCLATSLRFSPDGSLLAVASTSDIQLWDPLKGEKVTRNGGARLQGHAVAFSRDGSLLAGVCGRTIHVWDAKTGAELRTFDGHDSAVNGVAFSRDGMVLASVGSDKTVRLWNAESGESIHAYPPPKGDKVGFFAGLYRGVARINRDVATVAFSSDGTYLATVGRKSRSVHLWSTQDFEYLAALEGKGTWASALAFSQDGQRLASDDGEANTIAIWNPETGRRIATLSGHTSEILALAFSPDGKTLVSGSEDKTLRIWELANYKCLRVLEGHTDFVAAVAVSPDGKTLASAGDDKSVRLWDTRTGECRRVLLGHTEWVRALAFSPGGRFLVSAGDDKSLRMWEIETGACTQTLQGHDGWVFSIAFSPDGSRLASASADKTIRLWTLHLADGATETPRASAKAPPNNGSREDGSRDGLEAERRRLCELLNRASSLGLGQPAPSATSRRGRRPANKDRGPAGGGKR